MIVDVTDQEIKVTLFDIDNNKAPGPDCFSSCFFKKAWEFIGHDVCDDIKEFFYNGKLLGEANATMIALVPKCSVPLKVSDFRRIALKQKSLWEISLNASDSWGWKNMLDLRDKIKDIVIYKIGNGEKISLWHDRWCEQGHFINFISNRSIYDARLKANATVAEMIVDGNWIWPTEWKEKYPTFRYIQCHAMVENIDDKVMWPNRCSVTVLYSIKNVWNDLRGVWPITIWHHVIWFTQLNLKHAFIMWMAIHRKLMTQDMIKVWNRDDDLKYHLDYDSMDEVVKFLEEHACKNNIWRVMNRLILAAVTYYIWQERNDMFLKKECKSEMKLCSIIKDNIKNKKMSFRVKRSSVVMNVIEA
nr:hypothetical protein [Tanacetum cinerariifolium]